jgi:hypothetical protein
MTEDEEDAAAAMIKLHDNVEELVNGAINKAFALAGIHSHGHFGSSYAYMLKAILEKHDSLHDLHKMRIQNLEDEIARLKALTVGGR